jgi:hypothetical protein
MPVTYTNRKGVTFYLSAGLTRSGKPRYSFTLRPGPGAPDEIPAGYEIVEGVNGRVTLSRLGTLLILPDELAALDKAIKRHPNPGNYRVAARKDEVVIHEGAGAAMELLAAMLPPEKLAGMMDLITGKFEHLARYTPLLRFVLIDPTRRIFRAERWAYGTLAQDWIDMKRTGTMPELARKLVPLLGADAFFELA